MKLSVSAATVLMLALILWPDATGHRAAAIYRIRTVVIDPGHGGHDSGCLGVHSKEKHIALEIGLRLGKLIEQHYPDVKVIYTRTKDVFVELHERASIANRAKADLFICIHANSSESPSAFGTETFVMGLHKTNENLAVARRENASILYEKDYKTKYDGYDPSSPEAHIIFNLFQKAYMEQSLLFAAKIQNEFEEYAGRFNRGVKQAGFLVLYRTSMPAVLIETGFLSNKAEEKYLASEKGQNDMSMSIFRAFRSYKIDMEGSDPALLTDKPSAVPLKKDTIKTESKPDSVKKNGIASSDSIRKTADPALSAADTIKVNAVDSLKPSKKPRQTMPEATNSTAKTEREMAEKPSTASPSASEPLLFYTVQIGVVNPESRAGTERFEKINAIPVKAENGYIRYTVGRFTRLEEAMQKQNELRNQGFRDAFVTPYYKGKRISLTEAARIKEQ